MNKSIKSQHVNRYTIIQSSPPRTGSTLLINIIYGMYCPDLHVTYVSSYNKLALLNTPEKEKKFIFKTHCTDLQRIMSTDNARKFLFICSSRPSLGIRKTIDQQYLSYNNVLNIRYKDIAEKTQPDIDKVIHHVYYKIKNFIGDKITLPGTDSENIHKIHERIDGMNKRYEELKNKPFNVRCPFYHIHGSHKNRDKKRREG